jgi:hypothetical protein
VVGTHAANRYTADVRDGTGRRIEVRFTSRWHRTTIRVELRDGQLIPTTSEWDVPTTPSPTPTQAPAPATTATAPSGPPASTRSGHAEGGSPHDGSWGGGGPGPGG